MSSLNLANQIPNSIVTLEQHAAWSILALARINPNLAVLETEARAELAVQTGIFRAADETTRLLLRASIELDPAFSSDTSKKLWMFAREFGQTQIPASFTTN